MGTNMTQEEEASLSKPSRTKDHLDEYLAALKKEEELGRRLKEAQRDRKEAEQFLARHMTPKTAKPGERFSFWTAVDGDQRLLSVEPTVYLGGSSFEFRVTLESAKRLDDADSEE